MEEQIGSGEAVQLLSLVRLCYPRDCIQISQKVGKVVRYSHLFKNFPQFIVTYTVKALAFIKISHQ